jgi:hypothetical protein
MAFPVPVPVPFPFPVPFLVRIRVRVSLQVPVLTDVSPSVELHHTQSTLIYCYDSNDVAISK